MTKPQQPKFLMTAIEDWQSERITLSRLAELYKVQLRDLDDRLHRLAERHGVDNPRYISTLDVVNALNRSKPEEVSDGF